MHYVPDNTPTYFIDPNPAVNNSKNLTVIESTATKGVREFINQL